MIGPTAAPPCECTSLTVSAKGSINVGDADLRGRAHLRLHLKWAMGCQGGAGGCEGSLTIEAGGTAKVISPRHASVTCKGNCAGAPLTVIRGSSLLHIASTALVSHRRAGTSFHVKITRFCHRTNETVNLGVETLTIVFGPAGFADKKKSDLNGDGKPDG